MAKGFNLTAELNLRGPSNIKAVVSDIRRQIGSVSATVIPVLDKSSLKSISSDIKKQLGTITGNINVRLNPSSAKNITNDVKKLLGSIAANINIGVNASSVKSAGKTIKQQLSGLIVPIGVSASATSINQIKSKIKNQLGSLNVTVNVKLNSTVNQTLGAYNTNLTRLNNLLNQTATNATAAASSIDALAAAMRSASGVRLQPLNTNLGNIGNSASRTGQAISGATGEVENFGRQAGLAIRRFAAFSTVAGVAYGITSALKNGVAAFIEYDQQLTKISQVTGDAKDKLGDITSTINNLSTSLGVSSSELASTTLTLAQAGLTAKDTERALKALALSALAPSFDDMNQTVEGSIALMRQFNIGSSQLENALGSINAVSAKFAVEASDIITAIQRTGGVFAASSRGVSEGTNALNEFIAVFTSIRATTRESAETIATGLRTIFTRIQRSETIEALKEFGVTLTDLEGKFVGPYIAVQRLSEGLSRLDPRDLKFSSIVEELGGFRQIGKVLPLIQQFGTAQEALKVAQEGQGSLASDAAKGQQALAVQISKVRQEFLALIRSVGNTDTFQNIVKVGLDLASALIKVADAAKGIIPLLGLFAALKGAQAVTQFAGGFGKGFRGVGPGQRAAEGGPIRHFASGGYVPGFGNGDTVSAKLTPGEFVMRKSAVQSIGVGNLHALNRNSGGIIPSSSDIQRFEKGSLVNKKARKESKKPIKNEFGFTEIVTPPSRVLQESHITELLPLSTKQIRQAVSGTQNKKLSFSIEQALGTNPKEINKKKPFESVHSLVEQSTDSQIRWLSKEIGLDAQRDIKINLPSNYNQALKRGDPRLVAKSELINWISSSNSVLNPLPKKIKSLVNKNQITSLISNISPRNPPSKTFNTLAYDEDSELTSLGRYIQGIYKTSGVSNSIILKFNGASKDFYRKLGGYGPRTGGRGDRASISAKKIGMSTGGIIQNFGIGGVAKQVSRTVGVIDSDSWKEDPVVAAQMKTMGITKLDEYKVHMSNLVATKRKSGGLRRLRTVFGAAASGKTTTAYGGARSEEADNAKLRKTTRRSIRVPSDLEGLDEVIDTTSVLNPRNASSLIASDRIRVLSSRSKASQKAVLGRRKGRDRLSESGVPDPSGRNYGLWNRNPGATDGAPDNTGIDEAWLAASEVSGVDRKKVTTTDVATGRRIGAPNVRTPEKTTVFSGNAGPMTSGHVEAIMKGSKKAKTRPEDTVIYVAGNTPIDPFTRDDQRERTAIFPQKSSSGPSRVGMAQAVLGSKGFNVSAAPKGIAPGAFPKAFKIEGEEDSYVVPKSTGNAAIVGDDKPDSTIERNRAQGYEPIKIARNGISGTDARAAIMSNDVKAMERLLTPEGIAYLKPHMATLQKRPKLLDSILARIQENAQKGRGRAGRYSSSLAELSTLPARVTAKTPSDVANRVKDLRAQRDTDEAILGRRAARMLPKLERLGKSSGGSIQRFEIGGTATEPDVTTSTKASAGDIIKVLGLEKAAAAGGISATEVYTTLNKRTPTPQQAASKAAILAEFTKQKTTLASKAAASQTRKQNKATAKGLVFGAAGLFGSPFASQPVIETIQDSKLKDPNKQHTVSIYSGVYKNQKRASSIDASFDKAVDTIPMQQAKKEKRAEMSAQKKRVGTILGGFESGRELALDFDRTLAFGADKILADPRQPRFSEFSDAPKVTEALGKAKLSILGRQLVSLVGKKPELLKNIRVITARPKATLPLIQTWLSSKGLPIQAGQFKGFGGPTVSGSDIAKLKAAELTPGSIFVDDDKRNAGVAKQRADEGIDVYRYRGVKKLKENTQSLENIESLKGNLLEAFIRRLGAVGSPKGNGFDFMNGLGKVSQKFEPKLPPKIPTDVKRTLAGPSTIKDNIITYLKNVKGYNNGGTVQTFMSGGAATKTKKPKEVFGTGETTFPTRISKKYAEEQHSASERSRAKLAWDKNPKDERIMIDDEKVKMASQQPFDKARFIASFKEKISRDTLFDRMSDFAKFIGLPQEDLTTALPLQLDFGASKRGGGLGMFAAAQFEKGATGIRPYEGYDLSKFGYGEKQKQEAYGLEKLITAKEKEIKKIRNTPTRTYDDGSFSFDSEAYSKANIELDSLKNKSFTLTNLKFDAEKAALAGQNATSSATGRGTISFAPSMGYSSDTKNSTLYHEMTHQLFQGLRTRSAESFNKYRTKVASLFSGDNNDLADAFDSLTAGGGYSSADVVYGRSYKSNNLSQILSSYYRQNLDFSRGTTTIPQDTTKNLASLSNQSTAAKRAREYRPINPKVNQALLQAGDKFGMTQEKINRMEDNGKEEFLTTLIEKAPQLDQNLQGILDSTLSELLGGAGIKRQKYAAGGKVDYYSLEKNSGFKPGEFDLLVNFAKTNRLSLKDFEKYLQQRSAYKQQNSGLRMNPASVLRAITPETPRTTDKQRALADQLKGEPDAGYRPIPTGAQRIASDRLAVQKATRGFADGGHSADTVPALVSNGEAYVPPAMARSIGYGKLRQMNRADRNGMSSFAGGGISVFKGSGTGTSDSIGPIGLPVGSFIIREKATKALGLSSGGSVGGPVSVQEFAAGGAIQRFFFGGSPVKPRPDNPTAANIGVSDSIVSQLREVTEALTRLGITSSSTADLFRKGGAISYQAATRAMEADLLRMRVAGASATTLYQAEQRLNNTRQAQARDLNARKQLKGLSGEQLQEIDTRSSSERQRLIEKERQKFQKQGLSSDKIEEKLSSDKFQEKTNRKAYQNATTQTVGSLHSNYLFKTGVSGSDIDQYTRQSMMDKKTLAQMDSQLKKQKQQELMSSQAYGNASEAGKKKMLAALKQETDKEINARRKLVNDLAKQQGMSGPGSGGKMSGQGIMGAAFGMQMMGSLLAQNINAESSSGNAQLSAGLQGGTNMLATGAMIGGGMADMLPSLGKLAGPIGALAVGAAAAGQGLIDARNAAIQFEQNLQKKRVESALEDSQKLFEKLNTDIKNVDIQRTLTSKLIEAGNAAKAGIEANEKSAKAFWVNIIDVFRSKDQSAASQRSEILDKKGILPYLKTLEMFGGGNQTRREEYSSLIPGKAKDNARSFTDVSKMNMDLIGTKLKTGSSVEDIFRDPAWKQQAEVIARSNAAIEEEIIRIKTRGDISEGEKEARINNIIAINAEGEVRKKATNIEREKQLKTLDTSTNIFTRSLERMFQNMEQSIGRASFSLDQMNKDIESLSDSLQGQAKLSNVSLSSINTLQNPRAYSSNEVNSARNTAGEFFGSSGSEMSSLLAVGEKIEATVMSSVNKSVEKNPGITDEALGITVSRDVKTALEKLSLPPDLVDKLSGEVGSVLKDIKKEGEDTVDYSKLSEKLGQLNKIIDTSKRAQETAIKALEHYQNALNMYTQNINKTIDLQIQANQKAIKATEILADSELSLSKALGKTISLSNAGAMVNSRVAARTGGVTAPNDIFNNVNRLDQQRQLQETQRKNAGERGSAGTADFIKFSRDISDTSIQLRQNIDALKYLAENTDIAAHAMDKIQEAQQKASGRVSFIEKLVTSTPEELNSLSGAFQRLQNNANGQINTINRSTGAQKAYYEALQNGASMMEAMKAAQAAFVNERKETLGALNDILPFLGDSKQGNNIKANVLEGMLQESGMGVSPLFQQVLNTLRNPEVDAETKAAIDEYRNGNALQARANELLSHLDQQLAQDIANKSAKALTDAIANITLKFEDAELADILNHVKSIDMKMPGGAPVGAVGKATGGIIYAAAGQAINFQSRGTDTVPAMLTPGEFVVNRGATQRNLPLLQSINSNNYSSGGPVAYYAAGGLVSSNLKAKFKKNSEDMSLSNEDVISSTDTLPSMTTLYRGPRNFVRGQSGEKNIFSRILDGASDPVNFSGVEGDGSVYLGKANQIGADPSNNQRFEAQEDTSIPRVPTIAADDKLGFATLKRFTQSKIKLSEYTAYKRFIEDKIIPAYGDPSSFVKDSRIDNEIGYSIPRAKTTANSYNPNVIADKHVGVIQSPVGRAITNYEVNSQASMHPSMLKIFDRYDPGSDVGHQTSAAAAVGATVGTAVGATLGAIFGAGVGAVPGAGAGASIGSVIGAVAGLGYGAYEYANSFGSEPRSAISTSSNNFTHPLYGPFRKTPYSTDTIYNLSAPVANAGGEPVSSTAIPGTWLTKSNQIKDILANDVFNKTLVKNSMELVKNLAPDRTKFGNEDPELTKLRLQLQNLKDGADSELIAGPSLELFENPSAFGVPEKLKAFYVLNQKYAASIQDAFKNKADADLIKRSQPDLSMGGAKLDKTILSEADYPWAHGYNFIVSETDGSGMEFFPWIGNAKPEDILTNFKTDKENKANKLKQAKNIQEAQEIDEGKFILRLPGNNIDIPYRTHYTKYSGLRVAFDRKKDPATIDEHGFRTNSKLNDVYLIDAITDGLNPLGKPSGSWKIKRPFVDNKLDGTQIFKNIDLTKEKDFVDLLTQHNDQTTTDKLKQNISKLSVDIPLKSLGRASVPALPNTSLFYDTDPGISDYNFDIGEYLASISDKNTQNKINKANESIGQIDDKNQLVKDVIDPSQLADAVKNTAKASLRVFSGRRVPGLPGNWLYNNIRGVIQKPFTNAGVAQQAATYTSGVFNNFGAYLSKLAPMSRSSGVYQSLKEAYTLGTGAQIAFSKLAGGDTRIISQFMKNNLNIEDLFRTLGGSALFNRISSTNLSPDYQAILGQQLEGSKIKVVSPSGMISPVNANQAIPQKYSDLLNIAFNPYNEFPDINIRKNIIQKLTSDMISARDSVGQPYFDANTQRFLYSNMTDLYNWYGGNGAWVGSDYFFDKNIDPDNNRRTQNFISSLQTPVGQGAYEAGNRAQNTLGFASQYGNLPTDNWFAQRREAGLAAEAEAVDKPDSKNVARFATGGMVYAQDGQMINFQPRGTDTVPAMLTPGEFVINRAATQQHLPLLKAINSGGAKAYSNGGIVYLADGGTPDDQLAMVIKQRAKIQKEQHEDLLAAGIDIQDTDYKDIDFEKLRRSGMSTQRITEIYKSVKVRKHESEIAKLEFDLNNTKSKQKSGFLGFGKIDKSNEIKEIQAQIIEQREKLETFKRIKTNTDIVENKNQQQVINETRTRLRGIISQEESTIKSLEKSKQESGVFDTLRRGITGVDDYSLEIKQSQQKISSAKFGLDSLRDATNSREGKVINGLSPAAAFNNSSYYDNGQQALNTARGLAGLPNIDASTYKAKNNKPVVNRGLYNPDIPDTSEKSSTKTVKSGKNILGINTTRTGIGFDTQYTTQNSFHKARESSIDATRDISIDALTSLVGLGGSTGLQLGKAALKTVVKKATTQGAKYGGVSGYISGRAKAQDDVQSGKITVGEGQQRTLMQTLTGIIGGGIGGSLGSLIGAGAQKLVNKSAEKFIAKIISNKESKINVKNLIKRYSAYDSALVESDRLHDVLSDAQDKKIEQASSHIMGGAKKHLERAKNTTAVGLKAAGRSVASIPTNLKKRFARKTKPSPALSPSLPSGQTTFIFEAIDVTTGKEIRDTIDAATKPEAEAMIRSMGYMVTKIKDKNAKSWLGKLFGYQNGGMIYAENGMMIPYQPRGTDTVPAMLTPGEFVVNRASTQANLPLLQSINSGGAKAYSRGGTVYAAAGTLIGSSSSSNNNNNSNNNMLYNILNSVSPVSKILSKVQDSDKIKPNLNTINSNIKLNYKQGEDLKNSSTELNNKTGLLNDKTDMLLYGLNNAIGDNPYGMNQGGVVYAANGTLVNYQPRGTDTVPAMLTPGEFVVNRAATQANLPLLQSINKSKGGSIKGFANGGITYAARGGTIPLTTTLKNNNIDRTEMLARQADASNMWFVTTPDKDSNPLDTDGHPISNLMDIAKDKVAQINSRSKKEALEKLPVKYNWVVFNNPQPILTRASTVLRKTKLQTKQKNDEDVILDELAYQKLKAPKLFEQKSFNTDLSTNSDDKAQKIIEKISVNPIVPPNNVVPPNAQQNVQNLANQLSLGKAQQEFLKAENRKNYLVQVMANTSEAINNLKNVQKPGSRDRQAFSTVGANGQNIMAPPDKILQDQFDWASAEKQGIIDVWQKVNAALPWTTQLQKGPSIQYSIDNAGVIPPKYVSKGGVIYAQNGLDPSRPAASQMDTSQKEADNASLDDLNLPVKAKVAKRMEGLSSERLSNKYAQEYLNSEGSDGPEQWLRDNYPGLRGARFDETLKDIKIGQELGVGMLDIRKIVLEQPPLAENADPRNKRAKTLALSGIPKKDRTEQQNNELAGLRAEAGFQDNSGKINERAKNEAAGQKLSNDRNVEQYTRQYIESGSNSPEGWLKNNYPGVKGQKFDATVEALYQKQEEIAKNKRTNAQFLLTDNTGKHSTYGKIVGAGIKDGKQIVSIEKIDIYTGEVGKTIEVPYERLSPEAQKKVDAKIKHTRAMTRQEIDIKDNTGKHSTKGYFEDFDAENNTVTIIKSNGDQRTVPLDRLSKEDRELALQFGKQNDERKTVLKDTENKKNADEKKKYAERAANRGLRDLRKPKPLNYGGIVYAENGMMIPYQPRGTDTVPAMLTPGEFVINRAATQQHLPLLKAINSGSKFMNKGGILYRAEGGMADDKEKRDIALASGVHSVRINDSQNNNLYREHLDAAYRAADVRMKKGTLTEQDKEKFIHDYTVRQHEKAVRKANKEIDDTRSGRKAAREASAAAYVASNMSGQPFDKNAALEAKNKAIEENANSDKYAAVDQYRAKIKKKADSEEQERLRIREQMVQTRAQAEAKQAEKERYDSLLINSSNPLIKAAGYVGGVGQATGEMAYGAANVVAGTTTAAIGTVFGQAIDNKTGQTTQNKRAATLNKQIIEQQKRLSQQGVLGESLAEAQARVKDKEPTAAQAFTQVGKDAAAQGAYTAVELAQAVAGRGPIQSGDKTWLHQGDDKRVEMAGSLGTATRIAQNIGYGGSQLAPAVVGIGNPTAGASVLTKTARAFSALDNAVMSPGTVLSGAGKVLGAADKAIAGGRVAKGLNAVGANRVLSAGRSTLNAVRDSNFSDNMPNLDRGLKVAANTEFGKGVRTVVGGVKDTAASFNPLRPKAERSFISQNMDAAYGALPENASKAQINLANRYGRLTGGDPTKASSVLRERAKEFGQGIAQKTDNFDLGPFTERFSQQIGTTAKGNPMHLNQMQKGRYKSLSSNADELSSTDWQQIIEKRRNKLADRGAFNVRDESEIPTPYKDIIDPDKRREILTNSKTFQSKAEMSVGAQRRPSLDEQLSSIRAEELDIYGPSYRAASGDTRKTVDSTAKQSYLNRSKSIRAAQSANKRLNIIQETPATSSQLNTFDNPNFSTMLDQSISPREQAVVDTVANSGTASAKQIDNSNMVQFVHRDDIVKSLMTNGGNTGAPINASAKIGSMADQMTDLQSRLKTALNEIDELKSRLSQIVSTEKLNKGGIVYASSGTLIPYQPRGTDTVPAMLTPGEFVVNRASTQANLPLLKSINNGAANYSKGGVVYLEEGDKVANNNGGSWIDARGEMREKRRKQQIADRRAAESARLQNLEDQREARDQNYRTEMSRRSQYGSTTERRISENNQMAQQQPQKQVQQNNQQQAIMVQQASRAAMEPQNNGVPQSIQDINKQMVIFGTLMGGINSVLVQFGQGLEQLVGQQGVNNNRAGNGNNQENGGNGALGALSQFTTKFDQFVKELQKINLPPVINIKGEHTVHVVINGAEAFARMEEGVQQLVLGEVNKSMNKIHQQTEGAIG